AVPEHEAVLEQAGLADLARQRRRRRRGGRGRRRRGRRRRGGARGRRGGRRAGGRRRRRRRGGAVAGGGAVVIVATARQQHPQQHDDEHGQHTAGDVERHAVAIGRLEAATGRRHHRRQTAVIAGARTGLERREVEVVRSEHGRRRDHAGDRIGRRDRVLRNGRDDLRG